MRYFIILFLCFLWACQEDETQDIEQLKGKWEEHYSPFPIPLQNTVSFYIGDAFYIGLGITGFDEPNLFYRFTPDQGWSAIKEFPGRSRLDALAFVVDGKAYVGFGHSLNLDLHSRDPYKDFWMYDPVNNSWDSLNFEFPEKGRLGAVAFSLGHKGYVGTGAVGVPDFGEFYEFSSKTGWTRLPDANKPRQLSTTFVYKKTAYLCFGTGKRDVYKFSEENKNWIPLKDLVPDEYPNAIRTKAHSVILNNGKKDYVYIIGGNPNCWVMRYDPNEDKWVEMKDSSIPVANMYFEINNELYLINGITTKKFIPE